MTLPPIALDLIHKLTIGVVLIVLVLSLLSFAGTILYFELATHFRLQYCLLAFGCILLLLAFQSWKMLPLAVCCAILNLLPILPYYFVKSRTRASTNLVNLKLLQANALESNQNYAGLLEEVKRTNPDVLVLQEMTEAWATNTAVLNQEYPYTLLAPRPSGSGMGISSKHPLLTKQSLVLDSSTHVALKVEVQVGEASFTLLAMHPTTPVTPWKFKNRNKQFAEAASILNSTKGPRMLVGDLNATMWSPYFSKLLRDAGLRDARHGFGLQTTWPMPLPGFLRLPIDHCLVSNEWVVQRVSTGVAKGSDHRTVLIELGLPSSR